MPSELLDSDKLIAWLRTQPPDEEYVWQDPVYCLMGRYLASEGSHWGEFSYSAAMPHYHEIAETKPWTFGAALQRAEALKALPQPPLQIEDRHAERLHDPQGHEG